MKKLLMVCIGSLSGFIFMASCERQMPAAKVSEKVICVKTAYLVEKSKPLPIEYPGILSSKQIVKLSFKTGGIIAEIHVAEGSFVRKGQVIATLDMTEISSQADQARLAFEKAERDLNRVRALYNDTVATLEQLQDATSAFEAAHENTNIAAFNLQYSKITAPADGRIISRMAEEHELVGPGTPVLVFCPNGKEDWVVKTGLSDRDIVQVRKGDIALAAFDAFPGKEFKAVVSQIAEMADPQSGTFEVELTVQPENIRLINGLIAKIRIETNSRHNVTLVPPEAITQAAGHKGYVYVVKDADTTAEKIPVTIAYFENDYVAVLEPLNQLGAVVTEGASWLQNGSKIMVNNK